MLQKFLKGKLEVLFDEDYEAEVASSIQQQATTVLSSAFSPDGQYIVCGSKAGRLAVWNVAKRCAEDAEESEGSDRPDLSFHGHEGPIYSIAFVGNELLVSAGDDGIRVWTWAALMQSAGEDSPLRLEGRAGPLLRDGPPVPALGHWGTPQEAGTRGVRGPRAEVNQIVVDEGHIYAATGDAKVHLWDVHTGGVVRSFEGHQEAVYCVSLAGENRVCSGGEDGVVYIWDARSAVACAALDHSNGMAAVLPNEPKLPGSKRPRPYVSCCAVDDSSNWMVCGGGARILSLWHLGSSRVVGTMPSAGNPQQVTFHDHNIMSAGTEPYLYHWEKCSGKLKARVKTSSSSLFSLAKGVLHGDAIFAAAGNSSRVDIFQDPCIATTSLEFV